MAAGFKVHSRGGSESDRNEVWVDPQTRLPVRIETGARPGQTPYFNNVLTDFEWNVPVDPSLVDMTPPPGYTFFDMPMNVSKMTEADLIDTLKTAAELCGNTFPTELTQKAIMQDIERYRNHLPTWTQLLEILSLPRRMANIGRGLTFAGDPKNGDDWHYAGAGISLGQADTPILWYRPKGSTTYHVVYTDLTVRDVDPENLPQVESVSVEPWWQRDN